MWVSGNTTRKHRQAELGERGREKGGGKRERGERRERRERRWVDRKSDGMKETDFMARERERKRERQRETEREKQADRQTDKQN